MSLIQFYNDIPSDINDEDVKQAYLKFDDFFEKYELPPYNCDYMYFAQGFKYCWQQKPIINAHDFEKAIEAAFEDFLMIYPCVIDEFYPDIAAHLEDEEDDDPMHSPLWAYWREGYLRGYKALKNNL